MAAAAAASPLLLHVEWSRPDVAGEYVRESDGVWIKSDGRFRLKSDSGGGDAVWFLEDADSGQRLVVSTDGAPYPHLVEGWTAGDGGAVQICITEPAGAEGDPSEAESFWSRFAFDVDGSGQREKLGSGSHGSVFKATDKAERRKVAVKEVDMQRMGAALRRLLQREISVQKGCLGHDNLLGVVDSLSTEHHYYVVMPYMEGSDLSRVRHPLEPVPLRQLCGDLLCGLGELQRRKIVHRDIKPPNLLLTSRDLLRAVLKIADYGFARNVEGAGDLLTTKCGTPAYAAPEIGAQRQYAAASADTFSVGVVMWKMGSGDLPFVRAARDLRGGIGAAHGGHALPPQCRACCVKMLDLDAAKRPTVAQLQADGDLWWRQCLHARKRRDNGGGVSGVEEVSRGSSPSFSMQGHGLKSNFGVLCFSIDAKREVVLVGMRSGFCISAVTTNRAAIACDRESYRPLGGGVGAIAALGGSVGGATAAHGRLLAIAGGGRPSAVPVGTVCLWDENAGAGRPVDRIDVHAPVVSLAADLLWLAVVCPDRVALYYLDPHVGPVRKYNLQTASNPTGIVALRGGRTRTVLCFPAGAGKVGIVELPVPPVAAVPAAAGATASSPEPWLVSLRQSVRCRNLTEGRVLWRDDGSCGRPLPEPVVADCGLEEPVAAMALGPGLDVAVMTNSGSDVHVFCRRGRRTAQLRRDRTEAGGAKTLSFDGSPAEATICAASRCTVHTWAVVGDAYRCVGFRYDGMSGAAVCAALFRGGGTVGHVVEYGPERGRLHVVSFKPAAPTAQQMRLVDSLQMPARSEPGTAEEIMQRCPSPHAAEDPHPYVNPEPSCAARVGLAGPGDRWLAVAVVVREDELVLVPNDPRRNVVVVDHSWVADVQPGSGYGSHPYAVDVKLRFAGTVSIQFPGQSDRDTFKRTLLREGARSRGRPELSPIRRLWLFLLWQRQLGKALEVTGCEDARLLPAQHDRPELPRALGPCSLRHLVHGWIAGPRPCPPWCEGSPAPPRRGILSQMGTLLRASLPLF